MNRDDLISRIKLAENDLIQAHDTYEKKYNDFTSNLINNIDKLDPQEIEEGIRQLLIFNKQLEVEILNAGSGDDPPWPSESPPPPICAKSDPPKSCISKIIKENRRLRETYRKTTDNMTRNIGNLDIQKAEEQLYKFQKGKVQLELEILKFSPQLQDIQGSGRVIGVEK